MQSDEVRSEFEEARNAEEIVQNHFHYAILLQHIYKGFEGNADSEMQRRILDEMHKIFHAIHSNDSPAKATKFDILYLLQLARIYDRESISTLVGLSIRYTALGETFKGREENGRVGARLALDAEAAQVTVDDKKKACFRMP